MKYLAVFISFVLVLAGAWLLFWTSKDVERDPSGGGGTNSNQVGHSSEEKAPSKLDRETPTLLTRFEKLKTSFLEKAGDRKQEDSIRDNCEIRAALVLLREKQLPADVMAIRKEVYNRLNANHQEGYPPRSETTYVELIDTLGKVKAEHPDSYLNVLGVALLRSSYGEDREVSRGAGGAEHFFANKYLKEAGDLVGKEYYRGEDRALMRKAIAAFGKHLLGLGE